MDGVKELTILQFSLIYILLIIVLIIMKCSGIRKTSFLIVASMRMTVQLILAGLILTYVFDNPHPVFTVVYILLMTGFAIYTALSQNKGISRRFKIIAAASLGIIGLAVVCFFIMVVVGVSIFDPQYTIPISGMILGNAMTGMSLGLKSFNETVALEQDKITALLNVGVHPKRIVNPFVNSALETALLPTMNSMLGMGIISLPGMMTGQILAGTSPSVAILYQIAIVIAICAVTCFAVFCALHLGSRTLYNKRGQMVH